MSLLVLGTSSHAGKSTVVTALCRFLSNRGYDVAPYKAQNMSNNSWVTAEGKEMGISQAVQAWGARQEPHIDMNPVLLKPKGDGVSQVMLNGEPYGDRSTQEYYGEFEKMRRECRKAYERLESRHDVVICEGAGGAGEINLHDRDLSNIETARFDDPSIILVADIERGGMFASVYGTVELLPEDIRENVEGVIVNKFRGSREILEPGLEKLEKLIGVPVLGVLPYTDVGLPSEDSVSLNDKPDVGKRNTERDEVGEVTVIELPHISNFTDFEPLETDDRVKVRYVDLGDELGDPEVVVLPGTKNTVDDLERLKESQVGEELSEYDGNVIGICGGYQMLGERLVDKGRESVSDDDRIIEGLGILPVETLFEGGDKKTVQTRLGSTGKGFLEGFEDEVEGYEIHMGETHDLGDVEKAFGHDGAVTENVLGTYLHGLFRNEDFREWFVGKISESDGLSGKENNVDPYEEIAKVFEKNVDTGKIMELVDK